jgi:predicted ribosome quality control (RQC) complex YloA/Tae2 family protein
MDNATLIAVVEELGRDLPGAELGDVVQTSSRRFVLRFSSAPFRRLAIIFHPDLTSIHLVQRAPTPKEPTELSSALSDHLSGMTLVSIHKKLEERAVSLELTKGRKRAILVLELMGKASNLLLLDEQRRILRFLRSHEGTFRRPREGEIYAEPPPRSGGDSALPWGSRLLAREIETRTGRGEPLASVKGEIGASIGAARWKPVLYSPRPAPEITEAEDLPASAFFAAPFELAAGEGLVREPFSSVNQAEALRADLMERNILFRHLKVSLSGLVRGQVKRGEKLIRVLESEAEQARGSESLRRRAELILASLSTARKTGAEAELTDIFDPRMPRVRIPVDPRLDLRSNAEALFRKAKKLSRASVAVETRRRETEERLGRLRSLAARLDEAAASAALHEVEADLSASGLVRSIRRPERREIGRRVSFMKIRQYRTGDGHVVLVGRSGADNDALTFKIAAPHDFWLHAAGRSGAHVIVRNPGRIRELPEGALRQAAAIAAWYSRGEKGAETDVHYARRKDVRKGKGMSPGMVMLRSHRTIRVLPALPPGIKEGVES